MASSLRPASTGARIGAQGRHRVAVCPPHIHAPRPGGATRSAAAAALHLSSSSSSSGGGGGGSRAARSLRSHALHSHHHVLEETVDAIATVVANPAGSLPPSAFEEHSLAVSMCSKLQALNDEMDSVIQATDDVLEIAQWEDSTLPPDVYEEWKQSYRSTRKRELAATKATKPTKAERLQQRARRRADRQAIAAAEAPAGADAAAPQPPLQQQQVPEVPRSVPTLQQQPPASAPVSSRAAALPPLLQPQQQPQQEPPARLRRQRTGADLAAAPTVDSSAAASGSSTASSSAAASHAVSAPSIGAARPAPRKQPPSSSARIVSAAAAPAAAAAAVASAPAAAGAAASTASSALAPVAQPPLGFAPLPVLQMAAPVRAAAVRRSQRGAGIARHAASSAVTAAPKQTAKLADNTMHGLDMRAELLTAEQEKELAAMVQDLLRLEAVAAEAGAAGGRPLSDAEWMEAARASDTHEDAATALKIFQERLQAGRQAKQVMISANYKLVVSICRKYQGHGMTMGDLINEGIAGLVKGVERFQPSKGFKFSTYAHWWIRQAVSRSLADQGRLVRLPSHMQDMMTKMTRFSKAFEAQYGREPEVHELAAELGVDPVRIRDAYNAVSSPRSLDQPMGDAEGGTLGDLLEDERTMSPEDSVYAESLKQDLEAVLVHLSERDAGVLRMRYGLLDGREYTLDEVGAKYQVTRERIRQVEAKAIRQLRARQLNSGSAMSDYQAGAGRGDKALASRTSSGLKKSS